MIKVLFFGATADAVGSRCREIGFEAFRANDLVAGLLEEFPALSRHKLLFSVNQEYASPDTPINDGDEVAIFTAVSGG